MMLCYWWWKEGNSHPSLPEYFHRHMMYISDVEGHLLEQTEKIVAEVDSLLDWERIQTNPYVMKKYLEAEISISKEFHQEVLKAATLALERQRGWEEGVKTAERIELLQLKYNLGVEEHELAHTALYLLKYRQSMELVIKLAKDCVRNRDLW